MRLTLKVGVLVVFLSVGIFVAQIQALARTAPLTLLYEQSQPHDLTTQNKLFVIGTITSIDYTHHLFVMKTADLYNPINFTFLSISYDEHTKVFKRKTTTAISVYSYLSTAPVGITLGALVFEKPGAPLYTQTIWIN